MAESSEAADERGLGQLLDFILTRELAEVYLLLDHVSGRTDKRLVPDTDGDASASRKNWIKGICEIGWPPKGTEIQQADQAATLLIAKDKLNALAHPANGATIAFTVLVAGEDLGDTQGGKHHLGRPSFWRHPLMRICAWISPDRPKAGAAVTDGAAPPSAAPTPAGAGSTSTGAVPSQGHGGGGGDGVGGRNGGDGRHPPTRMSLARVAYPGLVRTARTFRWKIGFVILLLFIWLLTTCVLSWHVAAGQAILARLEAAGKQKAEITKKITDIENEEAKSRGSNAPGVPSAGGTPPPASPQARADAAPATNTGAAAAGATTTPVPTPPAPASSSVQAPTAPTLAGTTPKVYVMRYCDRPGQVPPVTMGAKSIDQFNSATEHQICDQQAEYEQRYTVGYKDIADWLIPWRWLVRGDWLPWRWEWRPWRWSSRSCDGASKSAAPPPCAGVNTSQRVTNLQGVADEQWAAVLVGVLAASVLPLCYGFLGAGAAVVRNLWGKMRDSLLAPRDWTLALGQLALGAVIGACIGLFVTPSGATASQTAAGLTGTVALSASALSFIAGFGVEGVFVALESFMRRVFNLNDPATTRAS